MLKHNEKAPIQKLIIRKKLRKIRNSLSFYCQRHAAKRIALNLARIPSIKRAKNIGLYYPCDGEISPLLISKILKNKKFFLPSILDSSTGKMAFARTPSHTKLRLNYFKIPEPPKHFPKVCSYKMDVILMPLVGFDLNGNRLGMGGGFYDRALKHLKKTIIKKPITIGVAHYFQQTDAIPQEAWDITVTRVVTDK